MQRTSFTARRRFLASFGVGALALSLAPPRILAAAALAPRVVVLDWGLAAQVLALGVTPVGVSRPPWYRFLAGSPEMPASVVDTGLLFQPNFEVVQELRPDLIVITPQHSVLADSLSRIAPLFIAPPPHPHEDGYRLALRRAAALGDVLGRPAATRQLLDETEAHVEIVRARLAQRGVTQRPIYLTSPIDTRLTNVFGTESVFGGAMAAIGLTNAWRRPGDTEGMAQVDYAQLGNAPTARAMVIGTSPSLLTMLDGSPLWRALPFVQGKRISHLPTMLPTGGTPTALRLVDALSIALTGSAI